MSYRDWQVGMEVVCVDASDVRFGSVIEEGRVYTLEAITYGEFLDLNSSQYRRSVAVKLDGVPLGSHQWLRASRFRPVQKRNTDISIFKRLLTDPNVKISEDA